MKLFKWFKEKLSKPTTAADAEIRPFAAIKNIRTSEVVVRPPAPTPTKPKKKTKSPAKGKANGN